MCNACDSDCVYIYCSICQDTVGLLLVLVAIMSCSDVSHHPLCVGRVMYLRYTIIYTSVFRNNKPRNIIVILQGVSIISI